MKTRSQIDPKYTWDLTKLCANDKDFFARLEKAKVYLPKFKAFEGKLNSKKTIWKYLVLDEKFSQEVEPIEMYAYLKKDEVLTDEARSEMMEKLSNFLNELSIETAFISSELHELSDELLDDIIKDKKFKNYDRAFQHIKEGKKHMLSKQEEKLLSGMDFLDGFSSNMNNLADADMAFGKIEDSKGKFHALSQSNYAKYIRSKDRTLRKNAMIRLNGEFGKHVNMLASNYINDVKATCYFAKVRKYSSALASALEGEEVEEGVYRTLLEMVNKNLPILFDYFKIKAKELGINQMHIYDTGAETSKGKSKSYTYDEAIEIIKEAVKPLGEEYVSLIQRAKDERWIDVYPNVAKRSGAYENAIYSCDPYVLTNFEGDLDSVFTLAHELGHAMHSYYSNKTQPREKAGYTIFLAEIASTTNEILLINYLLGKAKSSAEKKVLYNKLFDEVKGTIFRQTMFAEFEERVHSAHEKGEGLTKDKLCREYYALNQKYFGHVKLIDKIKYEWARIPHFYRSFYVYKYATGMICAIGFANRILSGEKGALEDYIKFLSAGASDKPTEILKKSNCDITTQTAFESCFDYLRNIIDDWKNL